MKKYVMVNINSIDGIKDLDFNLSRILPFKLSRVRELVANILGFKSHNGLVASIKDFKWSEEIGITISCEDFLAGIVRISRAEFNTTITMNSELRYKLIDVLTESHTSPEDAYKAYPELSMAEIVDLYFGREADLDAFISDSIDNSSNNDHQSMYAIPYYPEKDQFKPIEFTTGLGNAPFEIYKLALSYGNLEDARFAFKRLARGKKGINVQCFIDHWVEDGNLSELAWLNSTLNEMGFKVDIIPEQLFPILLHKHHSDWKKMYSDAMNLGLIPVSNILNTITCAPRVMVWEVFTYLVKAYPDSFQEALQNPANKDKFTSDIYSQVLSSNSALERVAVLREHGVEMADSYFKELGTSSWGLPNWIINSDSPYMLQHAFKCGCTIENPEAAYQDLWSMACSKRVNLIAEYVKNLDEGTLLMVVQAISLDMPKNMKLGKLNLVSDIEEAIPLMLKALLGKQHSALTYSLIVLTIYIHTELFKYLWKSDRGLASFTANAKQKAIAVSIENGDVELLKEP